MPITKNAITLIIIGSVLVSPLLPAGAEVLTINTDKKFYAKQGKISFSGIVSEDSIGLVTIVIRDPNDKFVMLTQAMIQPDNSYQKEIEINEKFSISGNYNVTSFITNMTEGSMTNFDYLINAPIPNDQSMDIQEKQKPEKSPDLILKSEPTSKIAPFVDPYKDPQHYVDRYNTEPAYKEWFHRNYPDITIEEAVGISKEPNQLLKDQKISGFPDPSVDPQHYVDRYNNEKTYREWFDRNFPGQTIYEVVGATEPEIFTESENKGEPPVQKSSSLAQEASAITNDSNISPSPSNNSELPQVLLAVGGLGILFGAVYGIKRKVDDNTDQINKNKTSLQKKVDENFEQISQNRFWLKEKLLSLKPKEDPISLIRERLAKGEITVDEYYKLLRALK